MIELRKTFPIAWKTVALLSTQKLFGHDFKGLLQPTPVCMGNGKIRVYCGLRDGLGVSRIRYIEISEDFPYEVCDISAEPLVADAIDGSFDDNGMVPTCLTKVPDGWLLFYAGYQIANKIKFLAFGGALWSKNQESFERIKTTPLMDRAPGEEFFRVAHSVEYRSEPEGFEIYYGAGNGFRWNSERNVFSPVYDIRQTQTTDWVKFSAPRNSLPLEFGELRIGRPNVFNISGKKHMLFTSFSTSKCSIVLASLDENSNWRRLNDVNIESQGYPDDVMQGYAALLNCEHQDLLFYNGNNYGEDGILIAIPK